MVPMRAATGNIGCTHPWLNATGRSVSLVESLQRRQIERVVPEKALPEILFKVLLLWVR
jgi:hypothetical protein